MRNKGLRVSVILTLLLLTATPVFGIDGITPHKTSLFPTIYYVIISLAAGIGIVLVIMLFLNRIKRK